MKIAILGTRGIPAHYGGFETFAEKLAVGLCERGFDVTVFCESGEASGTDSYHGVKLRYVPAPSLGPFQTMVYDVRSLWTARKGYDLVYMLGYGAAFFCQIPRFWGTEVWINPDGLEWARAKWGLVARSYFHLMEWTSVHVANRIIADADVIAASLARRHGVLPNCVVIPYGCDIVEEPPPTDPIRVWSLFPNGYYLVVCRLEPENHVFEILQAFQKCRSDKPLIVVGNHLNDTRYVKKLRSVNDSRVRMIGTVYDRVTLSSLRYYAQGYIHGHSVGGTNPSLLEAMGCGNLIFAHDNPFNRETLGPYGIYFQDAQDLATAINSAERETGGRERFKRGVQRRAMENYSWPSVVSQYATLLQLSGSV